MNCTLVQIYNEDTSILFKMRMFGIITPDEEKVTYKGNEYYCIAHTASRFDEDSLATLCSEESISSSTKKVIKTQYMKICAFAFMFGISKDCVRDKYNRLIPIDLSSQVQHNILENKNGAYTPNLVTEITDDIYERLDNLEESDTITSDQKWDLINKYQDQLDHDDLILEEPDVGTCCCCGGPCNPFSQTCGTCPRNGRLLAWGMGLIDQEGTSIDSDNTSESSESTSTNTSESKVEPDSTVINTYYYNNRDVCLLRDVIKRYKDQFKGCLDPKKAIVKKSIFPHYIVSKQKKQWVPCTDINERKAKILVDVSWVRANILGFFQ